MLRSSTFPDRKHSDGYVHSSLAGIHVHVVPDEKLNQSLCYREELPV